MKATLVDLIALLKPRVTALVIATTAGGLWLAPQKPSQPIIFFTLLGTVILVGAANALNMYLERDSDALMSRTMNRPLPARRMNPDVALWFGLILGAISLTILGLKVNGLTAILGFIAFVSYVLFYTPLKQKTTLALLIGAIPGAMPPLMGWSAATHQVSQPGLVLFAIMFVWQIPHFHAIALLHQEEYAKAGIKIFPLEKGIDATKWCIVRYSVGLLAVSLYPYVFKISGPLYLWTAVGLGTAFLATGLYGLLKADAGIRWARNLFIASIIYLPILLAVLAFDKVTS